jgi:hypothetical protein
MIGATRSIAYDRKLEIVRVVLEVHRRPRLRRRYGRLVETERRHRFRVLLLTADQQHESGQKSGDGGNR